jgi:hypothetical protein
MKYFKGSATYKSLRNSAITKLMGKRRLSEEDAENGKGIDLVLGIFGRGGGGGTRRKKAKRQPRVKHKRPALVQSIAVLTGEQPRRVLIGCL